jgi:hypothetical protein
MNRWLLTGLLLALAASLSLYGVAKGERDAPADSVRQVATPVKVLTLRKSTADEVPGFPGRVEAGDSALLAFRVGGQLRDLKVRMGNQVEQGAVLAELDPTDYQLNVDARQAEFDLAQLEADRASTLFTQKLISEDQYDTAQTVLATSRAKLQQAREQLSFCKLTAPFAGSIAFTYAMPSEVNLPPRYQPLLEAEDPAAFTVTFELLPGVPLEARSKEVGMQPDPDTNSYPMTLLVEAPADFSARPGMPVSVRLHHPSLLRSRWVLPREALFDISAETGGVLRSGLKPGDRIVAAGVDRLGEGQRVRPWVREGGL